MHSGGGFGIFGMGVLFEEMGTEQHSAIDGWLRELAVRQGKELGNNSFSQMRLSHAGRTTSGLVPILLFGARSKTSKCPFTIGSRLRTTSTPQALTFISGDERNPARDSIPERSRVVPQGIPGLAPLYVSTPARVRLLPSSRAPVQHAVTEIQQRQARSRGRGLNPTSSPNRRGSGRWDSLPEVSERRP